MPVDPLEIVFLEGGSRADQLAVARRMDLCSDEYDIDISDIVAGIRASHQKQWSATGEA